MQVRERTLEEIESKLKEMRTDLNKITYLESALRQSFTYDIKRKIEEFLVKLYEDRKMFDKAAKAISAKAAIDITFREKIESYLRAGELYAKAGRLDDSEQMFVSALRNANSEQQAKIKLTMKNIFFVMAQELERQGKRATALQFYEKLIRIPLADFEKKLVKDKLIDKYKQLGKFKEAKLLEGM